MTTLSFDQLMARLSPKTPSAAAGTGQTAVAQSLPSLLWVHGEEPLLVLEASDAFRQQSRALGVRERQVFEVDRSFKFEALAAELNSLSLFAEARLIELRLNAKPNKDFGEQLATQAGQLDDQSYLLVTSPYLDKSLTESAWFKAIDKKAWICGFYNLERAQLPDWIAQRLAKQGQSCSREALQWLCERVEGNLLAANQEIRKLALLFPAGQIAFEDLQGAVSAVARFDSFDLVQAALEGKAGRCLKLLDALEAEGEAPVMVLTSLASAARDLQLAAEAKARQIPLEQALRHVFWKSRPAYERAAGRLNLTQTRQAMRLAAQADTIVKGIAASTLPAIAHINAWQALGQVSLALCGKSHEI